MEKSGYMRKWLILIAILTFIDQITKRIAEANLHFADPVAVMPMFNFMLVYNEGAAFSFLSQAGGWQRWFFVVLALGVCAYLLYWLRSITKSQVLLGLSLSLIISGALGNLIDRVLYGKVTDFIDFYYQADSCIYFFFNLPKQGCHWPTFNIADILISLGAILMAIQIFRETPVDEEKH